MTSKQQLLKEQKNEYGYNFCQRCGLSAYFKIEEHHIIYKSEKPGHPEIDNRRNKILLCSELDNGCHVYYHNKKKRRNDLIESRNLTELFGNDIIK